MKVSEIFDVSSGLNLSLNHCTKAKNGINFVAGSSQNNGVIASVNIIPDIKMFPAGLITVTTIGSIMSSFVQNKPFYTGYHIFCLTPKKPMTHQQKIFYCMCLRSNAYRFSYGRLADRTLQNLELPDQIPEWVNKTPEIEVISKESFSKTRFKLTDRTWKSFIYEQLFNIQKGKRLVISKLNSVKLSGNCPHVSSIGKNNGVSHMIDIKPNHKKNTISVNYDGSVGDAYYQPKDFYASDSVNVLYPQFDLNAYVAMFLIALIKKEKQRYNYGRKWRLNKMNATIIRLPVDIDNKPDWQFMEDYIKSLPYSSNLKNAKTIP